MTYRFFFPALVFVLGSAVGNAVRYLEAGYYHALGKYWGLIGNTRTNPAYRSS